MHITRTARLWLTAALAFCLALTGLVAAPTAQAEATITPVGTWVATPYAQVRVTSISPALTTTKTTYNIGDVVTPTYRLLSPDGAPARTVETSSTTLTNAAACRWGSLPAGTTGSYNCSNASYTVTPADAAAGKAVFEMTWTEKVAGRPDAVTTISTEIPVTQPVSPSPSPSPSPSQAPQYLTVSLARTDSLGDTVRVGDVLTYGVTYTNVSTQTIAAFPRTSNLAGTLTTGTPNCRYSALTAGMTHTCNSASHTVTEADLTAGSFTATVTFDATTDSTGSTVLQAGITATAAPVPVTDAPAPPREEGQYVTLASAGYEGFTCHRIPALTQANNGWILAAWDGRPGGCGDSPNPNSIVQRISKDGGQTWGDPVVIAAGKTTAPIHGYSDPSYVTDRETGDIFAFFVKSFDAGWSASVAGTDPAARNVIHAAVIKSTDNGLTWSEPAVITADITSDPAWKSRFAASGEGIQLRYGDHKGRLIQQFSVNNGGVVQAVSVYSDDHGTTWQAGTPVGTVMDENKTVELSDGRVMLNSRAPGTGARKIAISEDGGETYGEVYIDRALIDPTNNASITRAFPNAEEGSAQAKMLLFSNAASTSGRQNGTVKLSYDDGQTWSVAKVFEPGSMSYSTLTPLAYGPNPQPGVYGLLFEGTSSTIRYMQVSLDWLGGLPVAVSAEAQTVNRGANTVTFEVTNVGSENLTGLVLTPAAPAGWTAVASDSFDLAAGETTSVTLDVALPDWADAGAATLPVRVGNADGESQGAATLTVELLEGQNPAESVPVDVVGTLPAQTGEDQSKMFDGDPATLWHTPWLTTVELPLDIDLTVGDEALELAYLEVTPRQEGSNGRITDYELYAGDSLDDLTLIASGTMANDAAVKRLPLDTTARFVRLRVLDAVTNQELQFVSIAELAIKVAVPDDEAPVVAAPVVAAISDVTVELGSPVSVTATATGEGVTYSATGLPAGVTIDASTGAITGTPTAVGVSTVTVTATNAGGTDTATFTITVKPEPTTPPATPPAAPVYERTAPYTLAGDHTVDGRQWRTSCEDYSQTERCRAEIWASVVKRTGNVYTIERGWAFNNLTYLPYMKREQWAGNPLGGYGRYEFKGEFVGTDGQKWRVECDTAASGRNGCRAYRMTTVYNATPRAGGGYTFGQSNEWVFNNIVLFGNYSR